MPQYISLLLQYCDKTCSDNDGATLILIENSIVIIGYVALFKPLHVSIEGAFVFDGCVKFNHIRAGYIYCFC